MKETSKAADVEIFTCAGKEVALAFYRVANGDGSEGVPVNECHRAFINLAVMIYQMCLFILPGRSH